MFSKCKFKSLSTVALASCAVLISCDGSIAQEGGSVREGGIAQNTASFVQMRDLPPMATHTQQETSTATRLITIKEEESVPPAPQHQLGEARIITSKSLGPSTQPPQQNTSLSPKERASPPTPLQQPNVTSDVSLTNNDSSTGYYTISFSQSDQRPQPDDDLSALEGETEPDSPVLEQSETNNVTIDDGDEDSEPEKLSDLELTENESENESEEESENESEEESDELDFDEDDAPIAQSEFGRWPSKSIQEVDLDVLESGAEAPEDRSFVLFESSQRFDGNVKAAEKVFAWAAPNISYQQLYFEDVALERYGQTEGLVKQPFVSAGRFLADSLLLSTRAVRDRPQSCDWPLGFCRPGAQSTITGAGKCGGACSSSPHGNCQSCR